MPNESLDFLDEVTPETPTVTEPTEANVSTDEPAPETEASAVERIRAAQAVVDAASANLRDAQALLNQTVRTVEAADVEIPLHVRNAEAKAIDQANRDRHNEALAKVAAAGVDVNRLIVDMGRPRPRKAVPPIFKP